MEERAYPPLTGTSLVLAALCLSLGNFLVVLDTTIANVSIPTISGNLGVSSTEGAWVITSYAVAEAITVPLTGWLASRYGQVRLFIACVLGFTLFSALCGMAQSLESLILFRVLQGFAGGPMIPMSATLILSIFPKSKANMAVALWGMTTVTAPIFGPLLGGIICDNWHWSWIFLINVPIGLAIGASAWWLLRKRETATQRLPIDKVGILLLTVFVFSFQVMLDKGRELDWFESQLVVNCGIVSAISLGLFVIWELTERHPVVDLSVFRSWTWLVSAITLAFVFGLFIGNIVITPLWLQQVMGYTPTWAGFATAQIGVLAVVTAPIVGALMNRVDPRAIMTAGIGFFALSFFMRAQLNTDAAFWDVSLPLIVIGAGLPAIIIVLTAFGVSDLPREKVADGAALQSFVRVMSIAVGSSLSLTYWEHAGRANRAELVNAMDPGNVSQSLNAAATQGFPADAALAAFSQMADRQAAMLGTNDFYALATVLIVLFSGLIWMAKRPKGPLESGGGH
ncbi:DHA2 family efflux MFS transporter permease subunit [Pseudomonas helleri]|uniref:DHA2 family efflux MFS transporter permease subunit n=2 Tax=Pseudomonas helleri TaxID=1608996 RepID=A0A6L5I208_9PSED|nr:DHA2 family efflux MFS transporter permease subunit [Pseudomonas helleri]